MVDVCVMGTVNGQMASARKVQNCLLPVCVVSVIFPFLSADGSGSGDETVPENRCKCNGKSVPSGQWHAGAGVCEWRGTTRCGSFCFVDAGTCHDQFRLGYGLFENYGYASCAPCTQATGWRKQPLKEAECPAKDSGSPNLVGTGIGLLAAGNYWSLSLFLEQSILICFHFRTLDGALLILDHCSLFNQRNIF